MFCLPSDVVDNFKAKIKDGTINPDKLSAMSSEERRSLFSDIVGEANAKEVNTQFESKLLLKNQQQGIINWAKSLTGIKPQAVNDIISRVNKMTEVLNPKTQDAFLEDLAAHKLGTAVTMSEAADISSRAKVATEARAVRDANPSQ